VDWTSAGREHLLLRVKETKAERDWLKALGKHIRKLIEEGGYESPYDFWIQCAGDHLSRATLNYILVGKTAPKATTLRLLAMLLRIKPARMLDFE
jgi:hypothetical protein